MPIVFIEGPPGIPIGAKKKMVREINAAVDEAYSLGETMIFIREYTGENVAINGKLRAGEQIASEASKRKKER